MDSVLLNYIFCNFVYANWPLLLRLTTRPEKESVYLETNHFGHQESGPAQHATEVLDLK